MNNILLASPVRQSPEILKLFLESLSRLNKNDSIDYLFVDDNDDAESKKILIEQIHKNKCTIWTSDELKHHYLKTDVTHEWDYKSVWRLAKIKDRVISYAKENNYDYLFLIDSDVLIKPDTIDRLISRGKDIICNIFWTPWQPNTKPMPQVWLQDLYSFDADPEFMDKLRVPGIYEVGGLGACTLISKAAIQKGVKFAQLHNVSFWGEDRHFCIRAVALGLQLFVDTTEPGFHIYRNSDIAQAHEYLKQ